MDVRTYPLFTPCNPFRGVLCRIKVRFGPPPVKWTPAKNASPHCTSRPRAANHAANRRLKPREPETALPEPERTIESLKRPTAVVGWSLSGAESLAFGCEGGSNCVRWTGCARSVGRPWGTPGKRHAGAHLRPSGAMTVSGGDVVPGTRPAAGSSNTSSIQPFLKQRLAATLRPLRGRKLADSTIPEGIEHCQSDASTTGHPGTLCAWKHPHEL